MVGRVRDNKTGKYVANPDKGVLVSVRIEQDDADSLKNMLSSGETLSHKVREAIAYYLNHHKSNTSATSATLSTSTLSTSCSSNCAD